MKVLMIGATGPHAGLVLPELKRHGATVRALVRGEERAAAARDRGADETVIGDLTDPPSLHAAARGVDGVFHIGPAFAAHEARLGVDMVRAAQSEGVRKFVFSGAIHPTISSMANHADKGPVEQALYESGMDYTVLQPAMFMQMLDGSFASASKHGQISAPYSTRRKMCYVDYRDVARVAAKAMTGHELAYGTFELSSPGMFDLDDLAAVMGEALGRPIRAEQSSSEAAVAALPDGPLRDGLARMFDHYDRFGLPGGNALVLRAALGTEPTTVPQYLAGLGAAAAGPP